MGDRAVLGSFGSRRFIWVVVALSLALGPTLVPIGSVAGRMRLLAPRSAGAAPFFALQREEVTYWPASPLNFGIGVAVDGYGDQYVLIESAADQNNHTYRVEKRHDGAVAWRFDLPFVAPAPRIECSPSGKVFVSGVKAAGTMTLQRLDRETGLIMWQRDFAGVDTNVPPAMSLNAKADSLFYSLCVGEFSKIYRLDTSNGRGTAIINTGTEYTSTTTQTAQCLIFDISAEASGTLYAVGRVAGRNTRGLGLVEPYGEYTVIQYSHDGTYRWSKQSYNAAATVDDRGLTAPVAYEVGADDTGAAYVLVRQQAYIGQAGDDRAYWYLCKYAYTGWHAYSTKVSRFAGGGSSIYNVQPDPGTARLAVTRGGVPYVVCDELDRVVGTLAYVEPYLFRLTPNGEIHSQQRIGTQALTFEDLTLGAAGQLYLAGTTAGVLDDPRANPVTSYGAYVARYQGDGADTDGDGLPDLWEIYGYTGEKGGYVDLPAMGADPLHKDVFLQINAMTGITKEDTAPIAPTQEGLDLIIKAYADAPVNNPDGMSGITLHIDAGYWTVMNPKTGQKWGSLSAFAWLPNKYMWSIWKDFDDWKDANFPAERWPIFHYCALTDVGDDGYRAAGYDPRTFGMSKGIGASDFFMARTKNFTYDYIGIMHELGHNMGLYHGGDTDTNYKPNYLSIMNYAYQVAGLTTMSVNATGGVDYSRGIADYSRFGPDDVGILKEWSLDESAGFRAANMPSPFFADDGAGGYTAKFLAKIYRPSYAIEETAALWPIDWSWDFYRRIDTSPVSKSLNSDRPGSYYYDADIADTLASYNDWENLNFSSGNIGKAAASLGQNVLPGANEGDHKNPEVVPYAVDLTAPAPIGLVPGYTSTLVFNVSNAGSNPDTYALSAVSSKGWTSLTSLPAQIALEPSESRNIALPVGVPVGSAVGDQDRVTVTVASEQYPLVGGTATGVVSVGKDLDITPSVFSTETAPLYTVDQGYLYPRALGWINSQINRFNPSIRDWETVTFLPTQYVYPSWYNGGDRGLLKISNGRVAYSMRDDYSAAFSSPFVSWWMAAYDLGTHTERLASMPTSHTVTWSAISGDWVTWKNRFYPPGLDWSDELWSWNLATNEQHLLMARTSLSPDRIPDIDDVDGSRALWHDDTAIHVLDLATGATTDIVVPSGTGAWHPVISGDRVAWFDANWSPQHQVHVCDLSTMDQRIVATLPDYASSAMGDAELSLDGDRLMWTEGPAESQDIVVYDFKTDTRLKVATATGALFDRGTTAFDDGGGIGGDIVYWSQAVSTPQGTKYAVQYVKLPSGTVAPVTQITVDPASPDRGEWYSSAPAITFTADQRNAITRYQWDGTDAQSWSQYRGPLPSIEGSHTLFYYSSDVLGNEEDVKSVQIRTDTTAPRTDALFDDSSMVRGTGTFPAAPSVALQADEPASIFFQWDGTVAEEWSPYVDPLLAPEGWHRLYFYSVDSCGNAEEPRMVEFRVSSAPDSIAPVVELASSLAPDPDGTFRLRPSALASADETAAIYVRWDSSDGVGDPARDPLMPFAAAVPGASSIPALAGDGWTLYQGEVFVPDGAHTLYAYAVDVHGNRSEVTSLAFNVDLAPRSDGAPALQTIGDRSVNPGDALAFTLAGSDPESQPTTYGAYLLPDGATLDPLTGAFSWTPGADDLGTHYVTFWVSDGVLFDAQTVAITVAFVNRPPVATDLDLDTAFGAALPVDLAATDADGDPLVWTAAPVTVPAHGSLSGSPPHVTYTPASGFFGDDAFAFEVADGNGGTDTAEVTVTVGPPPPNRAPVLTAVGDRSAVVGQPLRFSLVGEDPDGNTLSFSGGPLPSGATIGVATGAFAWTPTASQVGAHEITFSVSDGDLTDSETVTITVNPAPQPTVHVARMSGTDTYQVALNSSRATFATGTVRTAVVAGGSDWGGALAASGLAGAYRSPVLVTGAKSLPSGFITELRRLGTKKVVIVGNTEAVSSAVYSKLKSLGFSVVRISGTDRYELARNVALKIESVRGDGRVTKAFVVRGDAHFDAMSVSAIAYARKMPVLYTKPWSLSWHTWSAIRALDIDEIVIGGGTDAVRPVVARLIDRIPCVDTVTRWGGADRVATAVAANQGALARGWVNYRFVGATSCITFADGLSASSSVGYRSGVLLPVLASSVPSGSATLIRAHAAETRELWLIARPASVSSSVLTRLKALLGLTS